MVADKTSALIEEFTKVGAATFPGSSQVQRIPWSIASHAVNEAAEPSASWGDPFGSFFYTTVYHTDFDPEWPIAIDWPAVIRGLRGSLRLSQADFAKICGLGRATIERWEVGRTTPFRGDPLQLLTLVRPHLQTPVQAGQALNLAAAAVLPRLTRPTAEYTVRYIAGWLKSTKHDHTDLGRALLTALLDARILVAINSDEDEIEDTFFPLAGRLRQLDDQPGWALDLIADLDKASEPDRQLVINLARRLCTGRATH